MTEIAEKKKIEPEKDERDPKKDEIDPTNEETWKDEDFLSFAATKDTDKADVELSDDDMETSSSSSSQGLEGDLLPPWMDHHIDPNRTHPLTALHNEIVGFCRLIEPMPDEIRQREKLVKRIEKLVTTSFDENAQVKVFGSQATGLFLPSSDIDLVVITKKEETKDPEAAADKEEDWETPSGSPLQRFAAALREDWGPELSYLEIIENTRIPLVKFTHYPTEISVDVCFDQHTGMSCIVYKQLLSEQEEPHQIALLTFSGPPAAQLMRTYMEALPPLRPLTFVLKYFLAARGLNEPYSGGVGSYLLQLMIVALLQHRERDAVNYRRPSLNNLGSLLLEFLELYGIEFNYLTTGISVRHDGFFFPKGAADRKENFYQAMRPFMLAVENPLDTTMDVGKGSFRMQTVQRAFAVAYRMIMAHTAAPAQPTISILATILPPTEEMMERRAIKRARKAKRKQESIEKSERKRQKTEQ